MTDEKFNDVVLEINDGGSYILTKEEANDYLYRAVLQLEEEIHELTQSGYLQATDFDVIGEEFKEIGEMKDFLFRSNTNAFILEASPMSAIGFSIS